MDRKLQMNVFYEYDANCFTQFIFNEGGMKSVNARNFNKSSWHWKRHTHFNFWFQISNLADELYQLALRDNKATCIRKHLPCTVNCRPLVLPWQVKPLRWVSTLSNLFDELQLSLCSCLQLIKFLDFIKFPFNGNCFHFLLFFLSFQYIEQLCSSLLSHALTGHFSSLLLAGGW